MSFAEQLKRARTSQGLTQQQIADLMGITNSTYCGYETGKRQPDVAKIKQLASALNTSGDVLLETGFADKQGANNLNFPKLNDAYATEPKMNQKSKAKELSPIQRKLISDIEQMDETDLVAVKVFINSLGEYKKSFGLDGK